MKKLNLVTTMVIVSPYIVAPSRRLCRVCAHGSMIVRSGFVVREAARELAPVFR